MAIDELMYDFIVRGTPHAFANIQVFGSPEEQPILNLCAENFELAGPDLKEIFPEGADPNVPEWESMAGDFLRAAMSRLDTQFKPDTKEIDAGSISAMSDRALIRAKVSVKRELKWYDRNFQSHFGALPSRAEKEPMRPLYTYYRLLKDAMKEKKNEGGAVKERRASTALYAASLPPDNKTSPTAAQVDHVDRNAQIVQQLSTLMDKKIMFRKKLQKYQVEFEREHGRPIRYQKDVAPVEPIYVQYKNIKEQMNRLQAELRAAEKQ